MERKNDHHSLEYSLALCNHSGVLIWASTLWLSQWLSNCFLLHCKIDIWFPPTHWDVVVADVHNVIRGRYCTNHQQEHVVLTFHALLTNKVHHGASSYRAMHLMTTVTFPFESFTESVNNGLLSLFVSCLPSTHTKTSGKAGNRRLSSGKTQQQSMSISWSSLAPTDFSWKGGVSSVGEVPLVAITETLVSSSDTSSGIASIRAALALLFRQSSFVLPLLYRQQI